MTDADDYIAAKRTSGPWRVEGGMIVAPWSELSPVKMDDGEIRMHHTGLIALVYGCTDPGEPYSGPEANARLIAAAPELYEALRECVSAMIVLDVSRGEPQGEAQRAAITELRRLIAQGRDALAKAEAQS